MLSETSSTVHCNTSFDLIIARASPTEFMLVTFPLNARTNWSINCTKWVATNKPVPTRNHLRRELSLSLPERGQMEFISVDISTKRRELIDQFIAHRDLAQVYIYLHLSNISLVGGDIFAQTYDGTGVNDRKNPSFFCKKTNFFSKTAKRKKMLFTPAPSYNPLSHNHLLNYL